MELAALRGRSILVVEDEVLIGMDIRNALEAAGAHVTATTTVRHALILVNHEGLAGAIMDHALADGDSTELCARLTARGIPYVSYSGFDSVKGSSPGCAVREQARKHGHPTTGAGKTADSQTGRNVRSW